MIAESKGSLNDKNLIRQIQKLRETDNHTNFYYIARAYLYLTAVLGGTLWFYSYQRASGLSFWWNLPVTLIAIILVGAGQHQLAGLGHEGAHHLLFKHRYLNELASDWLCMFPLFIVTYFYRLEHLVHHQYVNDPVIDSKLLQKRAVGRWLQGSFDQKRLLHNVLRLLYLPNLVRYMLERVRYARFPVVKNPYREQNARSPKILVILGLSTYVVMAIVAIVMVQYRDPLTLAIVPAVFWLGLVALHALVPSEVFQQNRIRPVIPLRALCIMKSTSTAMIFWGLAWISYWVHQNAIAYFLLLWMVPLFTSFSFFMAIREVAQHNNADRGRLTNTRVFLQNWFINFCFFPIGLNYHLPHHLFASVPHNRLKKLHEILMGYGEYRHQAVIVQGFVSSRVSHRKYPTVADVLDPISHSHQTGEIYIDNSVLNDEEVFSKYTPTPARFENERPGSPARVTPERLR